MIQTDDLKNIPEFLLTDTSQFERLAMPENFTSLLIAKSTPAKIFLEDDKTLLIAGLYRESFVSVPHFWALISKSFREAKHSSLRSIVKYGKETLPGSETYINIDDPSAMRLAEFFGFVPHNEVFTFEDKLYQTYRWFQ